MLMKFSCLLRPISTVFLALLLLNATIPKVIATPTLQQAVNNGGVIGHKSNDAGTIDTQSLFNLATTHPVMAGIELSEEQSAQLYSLTETTREQIMAIISSEQQIQFQATLDRSGDFDAAVQAMNLSSQQKSQLEFIVQVFGFQAASILTPEQQRIISRNMESL